MADVGIILGSDSDLPKIKECFEILDEFDIEYDLIISSAHRTPEQTVNWVKNTSEKGVKIIIAAAGGAAHLPGVIASHCILPIIGIPIETNIAGGLDSILSILQMPSGIPVATMPSGKSGGTNAALYAITILAINNENLKQKLINYRNKTSHKIAEKNITLKKIGLKNYINKLEGDSNAK